MISDCFVNSQVVVLTIQLMQQFLKANESSWWFDCIRSGTFDLSFALCISVDIMYHVGKLPMLRNMF